MIDEQQYNLQENAAFIRRQILRPGLHEYVLIENDKHNDCITSTHRFRIVFISFLAVYMKTM